LSPRVDSINTARIGRRERRKVLRRRSTSNASVAGRLETIDERERDHRVAGEHVRRGKG
jgi:hypothetical protein